MEAAEKAAKESSSTAAKDLRTLVLGDSCGSDSLADCAVSFDVSKSNRGFSTRYGFRSGISTKTKKVLDCHTASKLCRLCQAMEDSDLDKVSDEWKERKEAHDQHCMRNHFGSAKSMEPDGAEILWERSVAENNLRYTSFVGDGDSSSYGWSLKAVTTPLSRRIA